MARIRTIKPKFWDDKKISKISRDARLTFIGMWNFSDDLGVIIADPIWIKSKIFPYEQIQLQQFEKWLSELSQNGFISLFSHKKEEFYYLPNLTKHQVINKPNYSDVHIQKAELESVIQSRINTGLLPDHSGWERKGMEGEEVPPPKLISEFKVQNISPTLNENEKKVMRAAVEIFGWFKKMHPHNLDLDFCLLIDWIVPLRELMQTKKYSLENIKEVMNYLMDDKDPFYKNHVVNTEKLAKHFEKVKGMIIDKHKAA
jgi:hypothetical protein